MIKNSMQFLSDRYEEIILENNSLKLKVNSMKKNSERTRHENKKHGWR